MAGSFAAHPPLSCRSPSATSFSKSHLRRFLLPTDLMQLIHDHLHHWDEALPKITLKVDRLTLAKRRWRAAAEDGTDFGFDLEHPLENGDVFHQSETATYFIE